MAGVGRGSYLPVEGGSGAGGGGVAGGTVLGGRSWSVLQLAGLVLSRGRGARVGKCKWTVDLGDCVHPPPRRYRGLHPQPHPSVGAELASLDGPHRNFFLNKLKSYVSADYKTTQARNLPRRSGWILRRHEARRRRRRQLSRCRAPTLVSAGSRSSTPDPAQPTAARAEEAPAATLLLPGTPAQDACLSAKGSPGLRKGAPSAR